MEFVLPTLAPSPVVKSPTPKEQRQRDPSSGKVQGFKANNCEAYKVLKRILREPITVPALTSLAFVFASYLGYHLPRECMRRKEMLIKWFDEHFHEWRPLIPRIRLEYECVQESTSTNSNRGNNIPEDQVIEVSD